MRSFLACVVLSLAAQAATTTNVTIAVNNAGVSFGQNIQASGPVTLTNTSSGAVIFNGTFNTTIPLSAVTGGNGSNVSANFTIDLSDGDKITGTGSVPVSAISSGAGTGSLTITGGTGAFANATGSFPSLAFTTSGSLQSQNLTLSINGNGTITTGGTGGGGGGGGGGVPPTVTGVLNNYSFTPPGFVNSGIAQGGLFIITGSGLADPAAKAVPLQDSSKGLPTTLNGASAKVTVNGTTTTPVFYYAIANQLAMVLPSNTPTGNGQITVTYNGQSQSFSIQVVKSAMGFDTYYGTGVGLGVATNNSTGALYNYTNSIPPGTAVVLWGSGLGGDSTRDTTYVAPPTSINNLAHVYVGGVEATILYQGASGYPGVNQVDISVPTNSPTGCNVSLVGVTAAGVPTNFVTLPVGNGVCSDPLFGISGADFQTLAGQSTVRSGFVALSHAISPATNGSGTQENDVAIASFNSETGADFSGGSGGLSIPGCTVTETFGTVTSTTKGLQAGTITVSGPNGSATLQGFPQVVGTYFAQLASGFIPSSGGSFTFNATAGADVGKFNTSVVFPNPLLTWTNQAADATVTIANGVLFTWTGGSPGTFVSMSGSSSGTVNGQEVSGSFTCIDRQEDLQFQVPSYVTGALPPGQGTLSIANYTQFNSFTASGLDTGISAGFTSTEINATYH